MPYIKGIEETKIPGVMLIEPRVHRDARGFFMESFCERDFRLEVANVAFVQDNRSMSTKGVIRGLHFQTPPMAQAKLVSCPVGEILDVAVDLRVGSPSYGEYVAIKLNEENNLQLFLPHGVAHGFSVLSKSALFLYKCDNYYAPDYEGGINPLDPDLGIDWGIDVKEAILSPKDINAGSFADFKSPFIF